MGDSETSGDTKTGNGMSKANLAHASSVPSPVEADSSVQVGSAHPGAVELVGRRLVGCLISARMPQSGVEVREDGRTVAVHRDFESAATLMRGCNQLLNSDFKKGTANWRIDCSKTGDPHAFGVNLAEKWHPQGINTAFVTQKGADPDRNIDLCYVDPCDGDALPVTPGCTYQLFGSFATHRCSGLMVLDWIDKSGLSIELSSMRIPARVTGGTNPEDYVRKVLTVVAPGAAGAVRIRFRKEGTRSREDSYLFLHSLFFGEIEPAHPVVEWAPPRRTDACLRMLRSNERPTNAAFNVELPPDLMDGRKHTLDVLCERTGAPLIGSPLVLECSHDCIGAVDGLEGSSIVGWARWRDEPSERLEVILSIDGVDQVRAFADQRHARGRCGFRLQIPTSALNGLPTTFAVREAQGNQLIGATAHIAPSLLTPWDALQRVSRAHVQAQLAPIAGDRYRALAAHIARCVREADFGITLSDVHAAHAALLHGFQKKRSHFPPLTVPRPSDPVVSVIVPVHNKFAVTYNCMAALVLAYNDVSFEVIVVDDGSTDATATIENVVQGLTVVRNASAGGFIRACKAGAARARGKYIVLLNNDTEPLFHWLDEMVFAFDNFRDVGLVGSKLLYADGVLQDAGGIVWESGDPWNYGRRKNPLDPRYCYTRQVDYVTGASLMIPTDLWHAVDGFDERFCPAYFEDTDLAFKVRAAGKKVVYAALSRVVHYEGMSHGTDTSGGGKQQQELNRPKFKRKWNAQFRNNGRVGRDEVDLVKDRGVRYRALFIDAQVPRPDNDAGGYAAIQEIRLVQSLGFKVTFLPDNLAFLAGYTEDLQRMGVETIHAPFCLSVAELLEARGREFDIVYITRYKVAEKHLECVRRHAPRAKVVFCNADLHFLRELRQAISLKDVAAIDAATKTRDAELEVTRSADVTLSYSRTEHAVILSHTLGSGRTALCPWVVDVVDDVPDFDSRWGVAFLGGFGHPPNEQAVGFFAQEVMPLLRQRISGVTFHVYGSNLPAQLDVLAADDVRLEGFVEDAGAVYRTCRVFVAPLLSGAGLKGKVVNAFAYGTPSVLSPCAAEGIPMRNGREAFVAASPQEWAEAVATLHTVRGIWSAMSCEARVLAREEYGHERGRELMAAALEEVGVYALDDPLGALSTLHCTPKGM